MTILFQKGLRLHCQQKNQNPSNTLIRLFKPFFKFIHQLSNMDLTSDEYSVKTRLAKIIASEIILSNEAWAIFKKWRVNFKVSQNELAKELKVSPSVVCDYESGRRKSPGIKIIKRYIEALFSIDEKKGSEILKSFSESTKPKPESSIMDVKEFFGGVGIKDFCKITESEFIYPPDSNKEIFGYTIVDSIRAITEMSFQDLAKIYGSTTQRALIFTKVSTGRTPIVAIKLTNLKPALVILHGLQSPIDPVAKMIAEHEKIPLAICKLEKPEHLIERLKKIE